MSVLRTDIEHALSRYLTARDSARGSPENQRSIRMEAGAELVDALRMALDQDAVAVGALKICGCGRRYTRAEFLALPGGAIQPGDPPLALHHCTCGSTLAMAVAS